MKEKKISLNVYMEYKTKRNIKIWKWVLVLRINSNGYYDVTPTDKINDDSKDEMKRNV